MSVLEERSLTKVVTQMVQFLSYSGTGDSLVFESEAMEQGWVVDKV